MNKCSTGEAACPYVTLFAPVFRRLTLVASLLCQWQQVCPAAGACAGVRLSGGELGALACLAEQHLPSMGGDQLRRLVWGMRKLLEQAGGGTAECAGLLRALWMRSVWLGDEEQAAAVQQQLRWMVGRLCATAAQERPAAAAAL